MAAPPSVVRSIIAVLGIALGAVPSAAQTAVLPQSVQTRIAAIEAKVVAWRRDIHKHPELGNREVRTAKLVAEHLKSLGIEVKTGIAHTGVVGLLEGGKPGPVVLLRADMDALPVAERADIPFASKAKATFNGSEVGVMHACGHDTHVAIMMGVAEVLAGMKNDLPGTVKLVFQPAEEGPPQGEKGGAEMMVAEGILTNPVVDVAFALHINAKKEVNHLLYTPGGHHASADDYRIVVKGKQTHGGYPWNGSDPIVASAHIITALQTIVSREMDLTKNASVITVGKITGGVRSNIIPEQVEMIGTIRALSSEDRKHLHASIRRVAGSVGEALGVTVEVQIPLSIAYPVTHNDEKLTAAMVPALQAAAGADRVHLIRAETSAEDFSFIADKVPSLYIQLGGRPANVKEEEAADHHTPDFFIDDSGLDVGVRALTAMTLHYMRTNPRPRP
jgi:amidohydrolase